MPKSLGTNLGAFSDVSSYPTPFLDIFPTAGNWSNMLIGENKSLLLPPDLAVGDAGSCIISKAAPRDGRYLLMWEGDGDVRAHVNIGCTSQLYLGGTPGYLWLVPDQSADHSGQAALPYNWGWIGMALWESNAADPVRNVRCVHEDDLTDFNAGQTFNTAFKARLAYAKSVRFMDWHLTNHLFDPDGVDFADAASPYDDAGDVPYRDWEHRSTPDNVRWLFGVPYEYQVQLCNELGVDGWFNSPVNASPRFQRMLARYIRDNLNPDLVARFEDGNEPWNWGTFGNNFAWMTARRQELFVDPNRGNRDANYFAWRASEFSKIVRTEFGLPEQRSGGAPNPRARIVINTRSAWDYGIGRVDDYWKFLFVEDFYFGPDDTYEDLGPSFDDFAITMYYDGLMNRNENEASTRAIMAMTPVGNGYEAAFDILEGDILDFHALRVESFDTITSARGLKLVSYESGYSCIPVEWDDPGADTVAVTNWFIELQRQPRIYDMETAIYGVFMDGGGTLYNNFGFVGTPSVSGAWDLMESIDQSEATAHRYRAWKDWNTAYTPTWTDALPHVSAGRKRLRLRRS